MRRMTVVAGLSLGVLGCAHGTTVEIIDVDTYRITCRGAAACAGGQACKADGTGYEPCDCGSAAH
jgi:hypothetical protein